MIPWGAPDSATLHRLAARLWPVVIVGAGIAGASAAVALRNRGVDVLLIDRATFPRDKTCGGCLNARAVASLDRLGLGGALRDLHPQQVRGVAWRASSGGRATMVYGDEAQSPAFAVSRRAFDEALVGLAVDRGASLLTGVRAVDSLIASNHRRVRVRAANGEEATLDAGIVLAADGLGSALARGAGVAVARPANASTRMGIGTILPPDAFGDLEPDHIHMACARDGYVGIMRVEGGAWDVAAAVAPSSLKQSTPASVVARMLDAVGIAAPREHLAAASWTSTMPGLQRSVTTPVAERLLLVGDAAGYVEPITGEGMAWALAAVEEAVPRVAAGWSWAMARDYERAWRRRVARRRWFVRGVAAIARRPAMVRVAMNLLSAWPALGVGVASRLAIDEARP